MLEHELVCLKDALLVVQMVGLTVGQWVETMVYSTAVPLVETKAVRLVVPLVGSIEVL